MSSLKRPQASLEPEEPSDDDYDITAEDDAVHTSDSLYSVRKLNKDCYEVS